MYTMGLSFATESGKLTLKRAVGPRKWLGCIRAAYAQDVHHVVIAESFYGTKLLEHACDGLVYRLVFKRHESRLYPRYAGNGPVLQ
jgi:hypothetical protein